LPSFAGADTTAIAINSILYHLMHNPAAYEKLTAEIDAAVADGTLSMPVAYAEAVKLPYLKACINEGMRLHPSVGLTMPRLVPAGGATISGFYFPEGYRVGVNGAVVQYDKDVFGPDADNFNPDRWIEGDAARMDKTMIQFGAGPRTCIGKNVSACLCIDFSHVR
jgi:cytochrome P450